jgi:hypothetical protein
MLSLLTHAPQQGRQVGTLIEASGRVRCAKQKSSPPKVSPTFQLARPAYGSLGRSPSSPIGGVIDKKETKTCHNLHTNFAMAASPSSSTLYAHGLRQDSADASHRALVAEVGHKRHAIAQAVFAGFLLCRSFLD